MKEQLQPSPLSAFDQLHEQICQQLRSGSRALLVLTQEENRAQRLLDEVGASLGWQVQRWSTCTAPPTSLLDQLQSIRTGQEHELWLILGSVRQATGEQESRCLREIALDAARARPAAGPTVILIAPRSYHSDRLLEEVPEFRVVELPLPDQSELETLVEQLGLRFEHEGHPGALALFHHLVGELARACLGLEEQQAEQILLECLWQEGTDSTQLSLLVAERKTKMLDDEGLLERVPSLPRQELGGLTHLKSWLDRRVLALQPEARLAAIPAPRGVMLLGIQGCGKSLAARCCADIFKLPLLRLDPARLFAGTLGESEANLRRVTHIAERMAPIVLWIDEIDKGLSGFEGGASDGGTSARVMGSLLTWLQEHQETIFVVATANRVDKLPPELLRRGRLDEIFFVDLPDAQARAAILHIHLQERPARLLQEPPPLADPSSDFLELARQAQGFSGAELEAALIEARLEAFAQQRPLAAHHFEHALQATVPLSLSHKEQIEQLRDWSKSRTRKA